MNILFQMKQKLMVLAGLPDHPTDGQLAAIINDIEEIEREQTPTEADWQNAAARHVPEAGSCKYKGEDMSDLNRLLLLIQSTTQPSGSGASGGTGSGGSNTTRK